MLEVPVKSQIVPSRKTLTKQLGPLLLHSGIRSAAAFHSKNLHLQHMHDNLVLIQQSPLQHCWCLGSGKEPPRRCLCKVRCWCQCIGVRLLSVEMMCSAAGSEGRKKNGRQFVVYFQLDDSTKNCCKTNS